MNTYSRDIEIYSDNIFLMQIMRTKEWTNIAEAMSYSHRGTKTWHLHVALHKSQQANAQNSKNEFYTVRLYFYLYSLSCNLKLFAALLILVFGVVTPPPPLCSDPLLYSFRVRLGSWMCFVLVESIETSRSHVKVLNRQAGLLVEKKRKKKQDEGKCLYHFSNFTVNFQSALTKL